MPGNEQQDYNDLPPLQTEQHPQPFSIPRDNQQEPGCSDIKGQPVVVGSPNTEEVEKQYLRLSSSGSTSTDISSCLELSAGSRLSKASCVYHSFHTIWWRQDELHESLLYLFLFVLNIL
jgi:hypothetical protein